MYNVVIVEDDALVRTYLRSLIDWSSYNLKLIAEKENGMEAKEFIENNPADIIITDISMPIMNGVELIKYIADSGKIIKVIALSCYSDYDFVREALKCGAFDYILKQNLTKDSFISILEKAKKSLDEERQHAKYRQNYNNADASNLLKNIMSNIIINEDEIIQHYPNYRYLFKDDNKYYVIIFKFDDYISIEKSICSDELKFIYSSVIETIAGFIKEIVSGIIGLTHNNEFTLLLSFDADEDMSITHKKICNIVEKICDYIEKNTPYTFSAGISNVCGKFSHIYKAYGSTKSMLEGYMLLYKNKIHFLKNQKLRQNCMLTLEDEKNLLGIVIEGDIDKAEKLIDNYISRLEASFIHFNNLKIFILDLLNLVIKIAIKCEVEFRQLFDSDFNPYEEIEAKHNIHEIKRWFFSIVKKIIELNNEKNISHRTDIIKAIEYIESHYSEDISLKDISDYVNISPNYFSMVFKKETGVSFSNYLLNVRLEKSKELLRKGNIRIYEIAYSVGFNNDQYFNRVFKDKYGITPLMYRKQKSKL
ncbi:response regulator transcription factor [Petroclostridium xylanilyticum]|uniref:response regulator transcription factor n=1 Tax=Petroclostridium xylanilyticum TaxID=1792311 RepID=UPI000B98E250|nr:response regulator [Petroclostridium xylanilyticum]